MCDIGVRCAGDTRGPRQKCRDKYAAEHGANAPMVSPLEHIEREYGQQVKAATQAVVEAKIGTDTVARAASVPAPAPRPRAVARDRHSRLANPEFAQRAAVMLGARGRLAGQGALSSLQVINAQKASKPSRSLTDPRATDVALRTSAAGARTAANAAHTGHQAVLATRAAAGNGRSLQSPDAAQVAVGALSAGGRSSAGAALSAQGHLAAVGKMPARSEMALA